MIKISLIMAAFNAEAYITEAIDSVIAQTYENWELIIVDDGSTDKTGAIIDSYRESDNRIKTIHQKNSGTAASARNTALSYVTGAYVQMIDADDILQDNMLKVYQGVLKGRKLNIVIPNCRCFRNDNIEDILWEKFPPDSYNTVISGSTGFELSLDWTVHGCFLVESELIQRIKYDPELLNGDEFTTRKLLYNAVEIGFADTFYYYRLNSDSTTKNAKNRIRMYECLVTDKNIYEYSKTNSMDNRIISLCEEKLIRSFCTFLKRFEHERKGYNKIERNFAGTILDDIYSGISNKMWKDSGGKYRYMYYISLKNYRLLKMAFGLLAFLKRG